MAANLALLAVAGMVAASISIVLLLRFAPPRRRPKPSVAWEAEAAALGLEMDHSLQTLRGTHEGREVRVFVGDRDAVRVEVRLDRSRGGDALVGALAKLHGESKGGGEWLSLDAPGLRPHPGALAKLLSRASERARGLEALD